MTGLRRDDSRVRPATPANVAMLILLVSAQADAQRLLLQATYLTLTANVVAAAVQEASLRAQLAATQDIIAISTKALELLRKQFALGYVARLDVAAQEAALAQVQQELPPLQKQLEQNRDLLAVLTGRFPSDDFDERFELAALQLPTDLSGSLPARLVEQRPDVRVAEETLHAAGAQVGVAIANRLPQFTISATYGGSATDFAQVFAHNNPYWIVGGTVLQTLFDGNTLHRQRAAVAGFEQAAAQYRITVLTAVQNVADTLYALQADAASLTAAVAAERAARRTLDLTLKQQLGYTNYLDLLSAQQAYHQTVITRVQAQASRFADRARCSWPWVGAGGPTGCRGDAPRRSAGGATLTAAEAPAKQWNSHATRSATKHQRQWNPCAGSIGCPRP